MVEGEVGGAGVESLFLVAQVDNGAKVGEGGAKPAGAQRVEVCPEDASGFLEPCDG